MTDSKSDIKAWEVASLLRNDSTLHLKWELLHFNLIESGANKVDVIRKEYISNPDGYLVLKAIIGKWAVEEGTRATVNDLRNVLKTIGHSRIADVLIQQFGTSTTIAADYDSQQMKIFNELGYVYDKVVNAEQLREYDKKILQAETLPRSLPILDLRQNPKPGQNRLLLIISPLLNLLSKIGDNPVSVISINGKQRSGKSFMATQFLKFLKFNSGTDSWLDAKIDRDFHWTSSVDRITSGIQIWHEPIFVNCGDKKVGVILMDTQGLHDNKTGAQENGLIFAFSALLSSVFIYNEKHSGDDSLQFLRSFLEYARFASGTDEEDGQIKFQKLILLLRDWGSDDEFKYGNYDDSSSPTGQSENLKTKMFHVTENLHPEAIKVRQGIVNSFEDISVYAMCGPGNNFPHKPQFKKSSTWDPNFRSCILDMSENLLSPMNISVSTKKVFGAEISGNELMEYVTKWAQLLQATSGAFQSRPVFETTAMLFYNRKISVFVDEYKREMRSTMISTGLGDAFNIFHNDLVGTLDERFCAGNKYGGKEFLETYRKTFHVRLEEARKELKSIDDANVRATEGQRQARKRIIKLEIEKTEIIKQNCEDAKTGILEVIDTQEVVIRTLNELKTKVQKVTKDCSIAKTVGSGVGIAGGLTTIGGIIAAPFTGGLSLALTIGGIAGSVLGTATSVGTTVVERGYQKDWDQELRDAIKKWEAANTNLAEKISIYTVTAVAAAGQATLAGLRFAATEVNTAGTALSFLRLGATGSKVLGAGLGVVGVGLDIYTIVDTWTTDPEILKKIDDVVSELESDIVEKKNDVEKVNAEILMLQQSMNDKMVEMANV